MEGFSLERLEVLGDAFLKYAVARHGFLLYDAVDEGRLTKKRSSIVKNSHLYELAVRKNLQVFLLQHRMLSLQLSFHFLALNIMQVVSSISDYFKPFFYA